MVGRDVELGMLEASYSRAVRNQRANLVTIFGEPGVGKSRLAREFVESLEGATVLQGRSLPYGEGITYWPLAEMVKTSAGINDDEPVRDAFGKLRACCEDEAVADLLAVAAGLLEAVEDEKSQQEIAWAARVGRETRAAAAAYSSSRTSTGVRSLFTSSSSTSPSSCATRPSSSSCSRGPSCSRSVRVGRVDVRARR